MTSSGRRPSEEEVVVCEEVVVVLGFPDENDMDADCAFTCEIERSCDGRMQQDRMAARASATDHRRMCSDKACIRSIVPNSEMSLDTLQFQLSAVANSTRDIDGTIQDNDGDNTYNTR